MYTIHYSICQQVFHVVQYLRILVSGWWCWSSSPICWYTIHKSGTLYNICWYCFQVDDVEHPALYADTLFTSLVHWTHTVPYHFFKKTMMDVEFKQTWYKPIHKGTITVGQNHQSCGNDHVILSSSQPMYAITPGQYCTLYVGEVCHGSGRVIRTGPTLYQMNYHQLKQTHKNTHASPGKAIQSFFNKMTWL